MSADQLVDQMPVVKMTVVKMIVVQTTVVQMTVVQTTVVQMTVVQMTVIQTTFKLRLRSILVPHSNTSLAQCDLAIFFLSTCPKASYAVVLVLPSKSAVLGVGQPGTNSGD